MTAARELEETFAWPINLGLIVIHLIQTIPAEGESSDCSAVVSMWGGGSIWRKSNEYNDHGFARDVRRLVIGEQLDYFAWSSVESIGQVFHIVTSNHDVADTHPSTVHWPSFLATFPGPGSF